MIKTMIRIVSIDPGIAGGYVESIHYPDTGITTVLRASKLPFIRTEFNERLLYNRLLQFNPHKVVVERQHTRPGFSSIAGNTQMFNYGQLLATIKLASVEPDTVFPITWASKMIPKTPKGQSKVASVAYATAHYPEVSLLPTSRSTKKHDGIADALCLLDYYVSHLLHK